MYGISLTDIGATFFITGDNKFLVKVISAREFEMFVTNAHTYFECVFLCIVSGRYMSKCLFHGLTSLLCKVFGIYQTIVIDAGNRKTVSHYVVVEEWMCDIGDGKSILRAKDCR